MQSEEQNGLLLALKQGNVATFGATSRHCREGLCQRRDVRGNVATFGETSRRSGKRRDVRGNVATFQRVLLTNVATLEIHVATFQRVEKSTSRRWKSTSRRSKELKNQRRDVGNPRHDVPETLKINVATFESTSRRSREG